MAIEVSAVATILDFQNISKWHFGQLLIALVVEIELRFTLRLTVSEIMAIEVSAVVAILDFQNISKWHFGHFLIALGVEIELRFALRSTVAEITTIKVSAVAAILDFLEHLKTAKVTFWANAYWPRG